MKKRTRLAALLLTLTLLGSLMAGCSSAPASKEPAESAPAASAPAVEPTAPTLPEEKENKEEAPVETVQPEPSTPAASADFEEIVVVDNEECVIRIVSLDPDGMWGYTANVYLENKSFDKTYMFAVADSSVNGVESDPLFASEVAPGKKANSSISWIDPDLEENGIDPTDIAVSFRVYDSNDWTADAVAEETVHIYPKGEENATRFQRPAADTDVVLVDNDRCRITLINCEMDSIWGYQVNVFLENKGDTGEMFAVDDASVNGFMIDPFWACTVGAGNCAFGSISFNGTELETNGIETVENIEMTVRVYNPEDFMAEDYANEVITVTP